MYLWRWPQDAKGLAYRSTLGYPKGIKGRRRHSIDKGDGKVSQVWVAGQRGAVVIAYRNPHFREVVLADDLMAKT